MQLFITMSVANFEPLTIVVAFLQAYRWTAQLTSIKKAIPSPSPGPVTVYDNDMLPITSPESVACMSCSLTHLFDRWVDCSDPWGPSDGGGRWLYDKRGTQPGVHVTHSETSLGGQHQTTREHHNTHRIVLYSLEFWQPKMFSPYTNKMFNDIVRKLRLQLEWQTFFDCLKLQYTRHTDTLYAVCTHSPMVF